MSLAFIYEQEQKIKCSRGRRAHTSCSLADATCSAICSTMPMLCLRYMLPPFNLWVYKQLISDIYINSCYKINRIASVRRRVLTLSKNGSDSSVPSDTVWPNKRGSYPREGVNLLLLFFHLISPKLGHAFTYRPRAHLCTAPFFFMGYWINLCLTFSLTFDFWISLSHKI